MSTRVEPSRVRVPARAEPSRVSVPARAEQSSVGLPAGVQSSRVPRRLHRLGVRLAVRPIGSRLARRVIAVGTQRRVAASTLASRRELRRDGIQPALCRGDRIAVRCPPVQHMVTLGPFEDQEQDVLSRLWTT